MRNRYLILFLLFASLAGFAQSSASDTIHLTDRSKILAIIDEVSTDELLYFLPEDLAHKKIRKPRAKVWKVVYANGEIEAFNSPDPVAVYIVQPAQKKSGVSLPNNREARKKEPAEPTTITPAAAQAVSSEATTPPGKAAQNVAGPTEMIIKVQHENAPETLVRQQGRKYKNYVGVFVGGSLTSFYSDKLTFPRKPFYNWQAGLGFNLANSKHYSARLELVYANKGSRETFSDQFTEITSRTKMTYGQVNLLPVILKAGRDRLNPAIGLGVYYAYRIKHVSPIRQAGGEYEQDDLTQALINNRFDYGACAILALYLGHKPLLEFRYEYGLAEVMKGVKVKNTGLSASLFFSF
nr:porin family protein [uncultured Dyadobacter sp.]